jgi:FMN phosphatase YigB (HAD superfamily)
MSVAPDSAVHVGDDPRADGYGAAEAGLRPILLDPNGNRSVPFETIPSLSGLLELLP